MKNSNDRAEPVLIVGSMAFDDLELPSQNAPNVIGGAATYAAYTASLFAPVRAVAVIGDDFPSSVLEDLSGRGVDVSGVERKAGKTFRWRGRYAQNLASRTTLDTQLNVFADFRPRLPESYCSSRFVLLGNIQPALQLEVLEQTRAPRFVAADTMNFWISSERAALGHVLKRLDLLVVNDEEVRQLAEDHNIKRAAKAVLAMGPKRLVVKRGECGAMLFDEHGIFFAPAYPLETEIDPTGAGDCFAGALIGYLASQPTIDEGSLRRALMIAATVASFSVEDVGTRGVARLSQEDVSRRLEELRALTRLSS
ncbi:MAG TPA: PfkB family carbohydrate kinase [Polyangiaceae bacterium]